VRAERPGFKLTLDHLEDRSVPAQFLWNGPNDGAWSIGTHWKIHNGTTFVEQPGEAIPPGPEDDVVFNSSFGVGGADTSNRADISSVRQ
jgi:hypothetical protein